MKREQLYRVKEIPKGGKRGRFCYGSKGTKSEAQRFAKGMRENFGSAFNYRVVKAD